MGRTVLGVHSHLWFIRRELLRELSLNNGLYCTKSVHSHLIFCQHLSGLKSSIMGYITIFLWLRRLNSSRNSWQVWMGLYKEVRTDGPSFIVNVFINLRLFFWRNIRVHSNGQFVNIVAMTTRFVYSIVAMFSGDSNQTFKLQSYSQLKSYLLRKTKRKTKRLLQFQSFAMQGLIGWY